MENVLTNKNFDGDFTVKIIHKITNGYEIQTPVVEDGVKWETERQGTPGKLTFKVLKGNGLNFQEGDAAVLYYRDSGDWKKLFFGFVFTKKRNKDGWIDVTAYDQLRYFKNKATYVYNNKKASEVVTMIANDYKLDIGTIQNTSYVIGSRVEDDQSLFDIIQNALDLTLVSTGDMYVLYDDAGKLCLKDAMDMKTNVIIDDTVAENFDYTSTIDEDVYNEIELYYDNDETNKREYYNAVDSTNLNKWGRLRYTENLQNPSNAADKAKKMLKLYNRKNRKLKVTGAFGNPLCRAGTSVIVKLALGDITVGNYMLIEKATHTFKKNEYRMDLTLGGTTEIN